MELYVPDVDLTFGDFALLSILLAVMYGLTGMESSLAAGHENGTVRIDRQRAAAYALAGVLLTVVAGLVAQVRGSGNDLALVLVPFFFIGHWGYYHGISARLADVKRIRNDLEDQYRTAVLASVTTRPATSGEVFGVAVGKLGTITLLQRGYPLARGAIPIPARSLVEEFLFTPAKVDTILRALAARGEVKQIVDEEVVKYVAPPQRTSPSLG